jgi:hypothetical protein
MTTADWYGRLLGYCGRHHWAIGMVAEECPSARQDAGRPPQEAGGGGSGG